MYNQITMNHSLTTKMIIYFDVLTMIMKNRIDSYESGTDVVTQLFDRASQYNSELSKWISE